MCFVPGLGQWPGLLICFHIRKARQLENADHAHTSAASDRGIPEPYKNYPRAREGPNPGDQGLAGHRLVSYRCVGVLICIQNCEKFTRPNRGVDSHTGQPHGLLACPGSLN